MSLLITTYLQDHHAGSVGGVEAFERVAQNHPDANVRSVVGGMVDDIRQDQEQLEALMERFAGSTSTLKDTAAWMGEKAGRLKPNERLLQRSPLSDLVELESLVLGVHGKKLLWQCLMALHDERLDPTILERLVERATRQESLLEELRLAQAGKLLQE